MINLILGGGRILSLLKEGFSPFSSGKGMDLFQKFIKNWEAELNQAPVLQERVTHLKSSLDEEKALLELEIGEEGVLTVERKGGVFQIKQDKALSPLIKWVVPLSLFKEVLLGKERLLYALLDKRCRLSFDTPRFTHFNGVTALTIILLACEMLKKSPEMRRLIQEL